MILQIRKGQSFLAGAFHPFKWDKIILLNIKSYCVFTPKLKLINFNFSGASSVNVCLVRKKKSNLRD